MMAGGPMRQLLRPIRGGTLRSMTAWRPKCLAPTLALLLVFGAPERAAAHPHIFIDTGVELIHDADGRLTALRISWTYDELFSLLMLEDLGLDSDYDGILTDDEHTALQGFDMDWPDWYEGDVYVQAGGSDVALDAPQAGPAELLSDGRLISSHVRPLATPVDPAAEPVVVKVYDPTYYTAYSILPQRVSSDAPECSTAVYEPDLRAARAYLDAALESLGASIDDPFVEMNFPTVGDRFAEEIRLECGSAKG